MKNYNRYYKRCYNYFDCFYHIGIEKKTRKSVWMKGINIKNLLLVLVSLSFYLALPRTTYAGSCGGCVCDVCYLASPTCYATEGDMCGSCPCALFGYCGFSYPTGNNNACELTSTSNCYFDAYGDCTGSCNCNCDNWECPDIDSSSTGCKITHDWGWISRNSQECEFLWDRNERKCVYCDGKKEGKICGDKTGIYAADDNTCNENWCTKSGDDQCEEGCGASAHCDEKPSGVTNYHCHENGRWYCTSCADTYIETCYTGSTDSDGTDYTRGGICIDYTGCSGGKCTSTTYSDTCQAGNVIRERTDSGAGCSYTDYDCDNYDDDTCWLACDTGSGDIDRVCNNWSCYDTVYDYCYDTGSDWTKTEAYHDCSDTCSGETSPSYTTGDSVTNYELCSAGQTSCPSQTRRDTCQAGNVVREWYCSGADATSTDYDCDNYDDDNCWRSCSGSIYEQWCDDWSCYDTTNDYCYDTGSDWHRTGGDVDCSQSGNWDGDGIACNCDCNGYDVEESNANGNCEDGKDNDCDGALDDADADCIDCGDGVCSIDEDVTNCPQDCCAGDCTATYDSTCHSECDTHNGCSFSSLGCDGLPADDYFCSDSCGYLQCCEGSYVDCDPYTCFGGGCTTVEDSCVNTCQPDCTCTACTPNCDPPPTNTYCVKDVCGAECDSSDDCGGGVCNADCTCVVPDKCNYCTQGSGGDTVNPECELVDGFNDGVAQAVDEWYYFICEGPAYAHLSIHASPGDYRLCGEESQRPGDCPTYDPIECKIEGYDLLIDASEEGEKYWVLAHKESDPAGFKIYFYCDLVGYPPVCVDSNGDGKVNLLDLIIVASTYGSTCDDATCSSGYRCWSDSTTCSITGNWDGRADLDRNEEVDLPDLIKVATQYGGSC